MFFIPPRDGIESGKVGIRDGIEFRSKISGRDAKNPGIFGTGWDRDGIDHYFTLIAFRKVNLMRNIMLQNFLKKMILIEA